MRRDAPEGRPRSASRGWPGAATGAAAGRFRSLDARKRKRKR